jgi:formate dehydrogenase subunit beta
MAFSCVNCGQCEDVCPMEIPVARIFHKVQEKTRKELGYRPGVDDEAPPALGGSCPTQ